MRTCAETDRNEVECRAGKLERQLDAAEKRREQLALEKCSVILQARDMRTAIGDFLKWENEEDRSKASGEEWMDQTEKLAKAANALDDGSPKC